MAIASTMVWECRASASTANGSGGFNPSNSGGNTTDYTLQDGTQFNGTDLAGTNANTATPTVTSATHNFVAADVGNTIRITAGTNWAVGIYEIKSVAGNAATLDRACASVASPTNGTWFEGGALQYPFAATAYAAAGNTVWVKNGSYSLNTTTGSYSIGTGTRANNIIVSGYNSTRGDAPTGSNRPTVTNASTSTGSLNTNGFTQWSNIIFNTTTISSTGNLMLYIGEGNEFQNCKFTQGSNNAGRCLNNTGAAVGGIVLINCELINYRGSAIENSSGTGAISLTLIGCYIHDSVTGVTFGAGSNGNVTLYGCIIEGCTTKAIDFSVGNMLNVLNCTLYGSENKTGTAIAVNNRSHFAIYNNIIYGFATGIDGNVANTLALEDYNNLYNNTANTSNWTLGSHDTTTNPTFTSVAQITGTNGTTSGGILTSSGANFSSVTDNQDFCYIVSGTGVTAGQYLITAHTSTTLTLSPAPSSNATADKVFQITTGHNFAPTGSNTRNVGFPGAFPVGLTTGYLDVGAAQMNYTDPGVANVKNATTYTYTNSTKTGTYDPITGNYTDPGIANVKSGVSYVFAGSTLNGTLASGGGALIAGGLMRR